MGQRINGIYWSESELSAQRLANIETERANEVADAMAELESLRYDAETVKLIEDEKLILNFDKLLGVWQVGCLRTIQVREAPTLGEAVREAVKGDE